MTYSSAEFDSETARAPPACLKGPPRLSQGLIFVMTLPQITISQSTPVTAAVLLSSRHSVSVEVPSPASSTATKKS